MKPEVLPLRYYPDPILNKVCEPIKEVTDDIRTLACNMLLTMMRENGIGLAAPQVGHALRMFVADVDWPNNQEESKSYVFINPEIELLDAADATKSVEGCLSFPGERFDEKRSKRVRIKALDLDGQEFEMEADGVLAVVIQHEFDHLNGKTVGKKLSWMKRDLLRKKIAKIARQRTVAVGVRQP